MQLCRRGRTFNGTGRDGEKERMRDKGRRRAIKGRKGQVLTGKGGTDRCRGGGACWVGMRAVIVCQGRTERGERSERVE